MLGTAVLIGFLVVLYILVAAGRRRIGGGMSRRDGSWQSDSWTQQANGDHRSGHGGHGGHFGGHSGGGHSGGGHHGGGHDFGGGHGGFSGGGGGDGGGGGHHG